jgi:hypothetical protein
LNTTDFADGVSIANNTLGNPTRITTTKIGKYNIAFSAQLHLSSGTSADVYFWMRHQEVDVPESATVISLGNNARKTVAAWNFFVEATTSPQYWEIMWYTTSTNVALDHFDDATTPVGVPAVPSLILTVNQVG